MPLSRTCEHCETQVPLDQPLLRVQGHDDRICGECLTKLNGEAPGAYKIDLRRTMELNIVDEMKCLGLSEQTIRFMGNIVNRNSQLKEEGEQ